MTRVPFRSRLLEIVQELEQKGVYIPTIAKRSHINSSVLYSTLKDEWRDTHFSTIEKLARGLDKISVVFYTKDGQIEDLGIEGFLYGEYINNYIGRVFSKNREHLGLTQQEVAAKARLYHDQYKRYENGKHKPNVSTIESICNVLGLVPYYLADKLPEPESRVIDCVFKPVIEFLEKPPSPLSTEGSTKVIGYVKRIGVLSKNLTNGQ